MKVFISYSTTDKALVQQAAAYLQTMAEVCYWDKDKVLGEEAWGTIFSWIDEADLVLALITDKTLSRAMAVGQEIGRAKAQGKFIIPIVGPEVTTSDLGFLGGLAFQQIDPLNPIPALERIGNAVAQRIQKQANKQGVAVAFLLIGALVLLSASSKS